jgi:Alpha/beta hydrolase
MMVWNRSLPHGYTRTHWGLSVVKSHLPRHLDARDVPPLPPAPFLTQNPPPGAPPLGSDPGMVNSWWNGLSAEDQSTFPITAAGYVGSMTGIPIKARDQANRAILGGLYPEVQNDYNNPSDSLGESQSTINAKLIGMSDLATRLDNKSVTGNIDPNNQFQHAPGAAMAGTPYLIQFDDSGQGRWVLSLGNPDTAQTIVVTVGGVGRGLNDWLFQDLGNNDAMYGAILKAGGDPANVAAIIWIGYDAPSTILDLTKIPPWPTIDQAVAAAPAFALFLSGLIVTHQTGGTAPHITVVGHSYGTDVVAETTLNGYSLVADDIVLIGSPGVPVANASELTKNTTTSSRKPTPAQVWASVTGHDYLTLLLHPLGTWPIQAEFGAFDFASDPQGDHGGYWEGSGLSNMANIALARYNQVTPLSTPSGVSPSPGPTAIQPSQS